MQQTRSMILLKSICLTVFFCASLSVATAQGQRAPDTGPKGDEPTLRALLNEVRLLRQEVQRANLQNYRSQVILWQLRIQQEHVDRLSRQLDIARNELAEAKQARVQLSERVKDAEGKINSEPDESDRERARLVLKDLQIELQLKKEQEQAKVDRESQLAGQFQTEQTALANLSDRMEALEREVLKPTQQDVGSPPKPQ